MKILSLPNISSSLFFDSVNKEKAIEVIRALAEKENPLLFTEESRLEGSRLRHNTSGVSRDSLMSANAQVFQRKNRIFSHKFSLETRRSKLLSRSNFKILREIPQWSR